MKSLNLCCVLLLLQAAGCAGYLRDRLKDASEMVEVGVGLSVGLETNVRATKLAQLGLGSYTGDWMGLREGRLAFWSEHRVELGLTPFYYHEVFRKSHTLLNIEHPLFGDAGYEEFLNDFFLITDRGFFEVGATVSCLVLGLDVAVEGAEVVDFLGGWFGLDLLKDDAYGRSLDALVRQAQSLNAFQRAAAVRALRLRTGKEFGYTVITPVDEYPEEQVQAWRRWKRWLEDRRASGEEVP